MKKIISLILVLVLFASFMTGCGKSSMAYLKENPDTVVATIGDKDIYAYEMFYYLRAGATKEQALEELYTLKAIVQEAEKNGVVQDASDIIKAKEEISRIKEENTEETFNQMLADLYITEEQYTNMLTLSMIIERFSEKYEELGVVKEHSDEDIAAYYDLNMLKAKHILITTMDASGNPLDEAGKAEKKAEASEILKQIRNGADFDSMVASKSEDPGSQSMPDGYLFINSEKIADNTDELMLYQQYSQQGSPISVLVEEFVKATAETEVGQVTDLVETSYGYHIIKRLDTRENPEDFNTAKEVIKSVKSQLDYAKKLDEWVNAYEKKEKKKYIEALEITSYAEEQQALQQAQPVPEEEVTMPEEENQE